MKSHLQASRAGVCPEIRKSNFLSTAKNKLGKGLAYGMLIATAAAPMQANGDLITSVSDNGSSGYVINSEHTNPFTSANVDSATVTYGNTFLEDLRDLTLGTHNYASVDDMLNNGGFETTIQTPPTGEVKNGWFDTYSNNGIEINHVVSEFPPGFDYDIWAATGQNASQDMLALQTFIPYTALDANNNGIYDPLNGDATISINNSATENIWTANAGTGSLDVQGNPLNLDIVPEPGTIALVILGGGLLAAGRRRKTYDMTPGSDGTYNVK